MRHIIRLAALAVLAVGAWAQTAINDTIVLLPGGNWTGTIAICWPAFTASGGTAVVKGCREVSVTDGALSVSLFATEGAAPSFVYTATFRTTLGASRGTTWRETWAVPLSPSVVTLAAARLSSTYKVFASQIDPSGFAAGKLMGSDGTKFVPVSPGASDAVTIQGRAVSAAAPQNKQALVYNSATSMYEPQDQTGTSTTGNGVWGQITGLLTDQTDLSNALSGKATAIHTHAETEVVGLVADLSGKQSTSQKGQPSGYASLDGTGKVPAAQLPASSGNLWGGITGAIGDQADLTAALAGKEPANANIQAHIGSTTNPHATTAAQVGLGNLTNFAQLKIASNLADLGNIVTARSNLGLGGAALLNVGTTAATVAAGDHNHNATYASLSHVHLASEITSGLLNIARIASSGTCDSTTVVYGDQVCRTPPGATAGEANTASNGGTGGVGLVLPKAGIDLPFKSIIAGSTKVSVTDDTVNKRVVVDAVPANIDHGTLANVGSNTHAQIDAHIASTSNPHNTTAAQVGLGNVDNTSDVNKPVSTAQQTALNLKAPLASPTFTGTVGGITKAMVGLGNVDNTSDANKPVSTAQQTALNLKANIASPTFTGTVTADSFASSDTTHTSVVDLRPGTAANFAATCTTGNLCLFLDSANSNRLSKRDSAGTTTPIEGVADASTNTGTSVDGEMVLFAGTAGKTFKRSTLTGGLLKSTSGVPAVAVAGTDYQAVITGAPSSWPSTFAPVAPGASTLGGVKSGQCTTTTGKLMGYDTNGDRICETDQAGTTGTAPYTATMASATTWTVAAATHGFTHGSLFVETFDSSGNRIQPNTVNVDQSTYAVTVTWGTAQAGKIAINGGTGPAGPAGTVAASLKTRSCEIHIWGDGTGGVLQDTNDEPASCRNKTGATLTITSFECRADAGSPTVMGTITGGSNILSGNLTAGAGTWAAGTLSGTPTQAADATIDISIVSAGGTAKSLICVVGRTL